MPLVDSVDFKTILIINVVVPDHELIDDTRVRLFYFLTFSWICREPTI
jgi:hypothetical protein